MRHLLHCRELFLHSQVQAMDDLKTKKKTFIKTRPFLRLCPKSIYRWQKKDTQKPCLARIVLSLNAKIKAHFINPGPINHYTYTYKVTHNKLNVSLVRYVNLNTLFVSLKEDVCKNVKICTARYSLMLTLTTNHWFLKSFYVSVTKIFDSLLISFKWKMSRLMSLKTEIKAY